MSLVSERFTSGLKKFVLGLVPRRKYVKFKCPRYGKKIKINKKHIENAGNALARWSRGGGRSDFWMQRYLMRVFKISYCDECWDRVCGG